jgi:hypothetical protein
LWEFKDESLLKDTRGVTVDNYDNVYVTSYRSNSVVVLEPDGSQGRQILNSDDYMYALAIFTMLNILIY